MSQETEDSLARLCKRQGEKIAALQSEVAALREALKRGRESISPMQGETLRIIDAALAKLDEGRKP